MTKQITIISGKGGTGKTSLTACFGQLARNVVLADCDVDAANLHLLVHPILQRRPPENVRSGYRMVIDFDQCTQCGECVEVCRFGAIHLGPLPQQDPARQFPIIDPIHCEGCGCCADICPVEAIGLEQKEIGTLFVSNTRHGLLVHARLFIAESNSGKLVARVREVAREYATQEQRSWLIIDGPPGIGCPVIASLTGVDQAIIVTEASQSGLHDFTRVAELCNHFKIPAFVIINKADLDVSVTALITTQAASLGIKLLGTLPYSQIFIEALVNQKTILDFAPETPEAHLVRHIWQNLIEQM